MTMSLMRHSLVRRGLRLEYLTVGWNILEGLIAIAAGVLSGSITLIAFGVDSFVETISGAVLIWRLRTEERGSLDEDALERVERRAERLVGVAFLVLAAYVAFESVRTLVADEAPDASPVGIVLTSVSIGVMLWLARAKRETGEALGSRALIADSRQTRACWYLSAVALVGLGLNAVLGWWWADPVAALAITVLLVREGREALGGEVDDE
jgi:cation diffusion facilitator family transporter